jgi:hypothetical protein
MEVFGYEIDFDPQTCYPVIILHKEVEGVEQVYTYRTTYFNLKLTIDTPSDIITDTVTVEELLIAAYWAYQDYLQLKNDYDILMQRLKKVLPKHMVIKRHFKYRD